MNKQELKINIYLFYFIILFHNSLLKISENQLSPDGKLIQEQYAIKAVNNAATIIGITAKDCVVLVSEIQKKFKLQIPRLPFTQISEHIYALEVGLPQDARQLINYMINQAQQHFFNYDEEIPLNLLAETLSQKITNFSKSKRMRPYASGFILCNDKQLYFCDTSGNAILYKAKSAGNSEQSSMEVLEEEWKENMSQDDAIKLAYKSIKDVIEGDPYDCRCMVIKQGKGQLLSKEEVKQICQ